MFVLAPVKRVKKLYVDNDDLEVPRRTRNRWKKKRESEMGALFSQFAYTYSSQEADLGKCMKCVSFYQDTLT